MSDLDPQALIAEARQAHHVPGSLVDRLIAALEATLTPSPASTDDDREELAAVLYEVIGLYGTPWKDALPTLRDLFLRRADAVLAAGFVRGDVAKAEALEQAADEMPKGSKSSSEYWDGERVNYEGYETSPRKEHPRDWLRARAATYRAASQKGDGQ